jgi:site-specific DNA-methyltransferase (adenine-specific)
MLEPGSVDMILTDPVYDDTQAYIRLLHKAQHVLRDDSAVLMFASTNQEERIRHVAELMVPDMRYTYTLNYIVKAKPSKLRGYNLFTWRTPVLWYRKGKGFPNRGIPDTYIASTSTPDGDHAWNKNIEVMRYWITAFTRPGDLVLDPFCGSGSVAVACKHTGRRHISIDIDSDTVQAAAQRYENVRAEPMLMSADEAYQLSFFEEDHG